MKTTKLSILGYVTGAIIAIGSFWRWFIYYNELKQTLIGVGLGFIVLGFAYLYQRVTELTDEVDDIGRGLDSTRRYVYDKIDKPKEQD